MTNGGGHSIPCEFHEINIFIFGCKLSYSLDFYSFSNTYSYISLSQTGWAEQGIMRS